MTATLSQDDDLLAAEYVLGVQDMEARALCEQRLKRDAPFGDAIVAWENRLRGLNADYAEEMAPDLLPRIEARLFAVAAPRVRGFGWLGFGAGAMVATALAVAVFLTTVPVTPLAPVLTTLATAEMTYEVRAVGNSLQVTRVAGSAAPAGQVHQLWLIASGSPPVSLGLLGDAPLQVDYVVPVTSYALAVSLEPAGGSPSGLPTGPVIATRLINI